AFGKGGVLKSDAIVTVANCVRSLSGLSTRNGVDAAKGGKVYAENCVACHGDGGKGNQEMGAPNLTDKIWLNGADEAALME
ncbi:c-type cytochrome, partial [Bradyrhizobium ottawaense]|uniref:c-type cytochrome n=1 Tax=Bradyrhizobium ottawaense TaxID=931866 RepID=UPI0030C6F243